MGDGATPSQYAMPTGSGAPTRAQLKKWAAGDVADNDTTMTGPGSYFLGSDPEKAKALDKGFKQNWAKKVLEENPEEPGPPPDYGDEVVRNAAALERIRSKQSGFLRSTFLTGGAGVVNPTASMKPTLLGK